MKKHWKKIVLVLAILLLSVAGYLLYIFQFKEYETADENVDQVVEEEYKVELPDGSTIIVDKEGNVVEGSDAAATGGEVADGETAESGSASGTASNGGTAAADSATGSTEGTSSGSSTSGSTSGDSATTTSGTANSSSNGSSATQASGSKSSTGTTGSTGSAAGGSDAKAGSGSANTGSSNTGSSNTGSSNTGSSNTGSASKGSAGTETGGVTVASIKKQYEPTLADIEGQAASRINGLIGAAQNEYATKKANGENIDYAYFYNKYMGAATELENRTDTVFYAVIGSLKNDLKANGLAPSHADSFVSEYEARKEARKKDLISKASGM